MCVHCRLQNDIIGDVEYVLTSVVVALDNEECRDFINTLWHPDSGRVDITQVDISSTPFIQIRLKEAKDNLVVWATSDGIPGEHASLISCTGAIRALF